MSLWCEDLFFDIDLEKISNASFKKIARLRNKRGERMWFTVLLREALRRYRLEGVPDTMSERVILLSWLFNCSVCFFKLDGQPVALPVLPSYLPNMLGDYKSGFVHGRDGFYAEIRLRQRGQDKLAALAADYGLSLPDYTHTIDYMGGKHEVGEGIIVWENKDRVPFIEIVLSYAYELADTWSKIGVARRNAAVPYIVVTEQSLLQSVKKAFQNRDNNEEVLVLDSGVFDSDKVRIEPIQTATDALKAHTDLIEWYCSRFDQLCGVFANANPDKKERLLVDEVNAGDEGTKKQENDTVLYLQNQLDEVNKLFGTTIRIVSPEPETDFGGDKLDPSHSFTISTEKPQKQGFGRRKV